MTKKKRFYDPQAPVRRHTLDEAVDIILSTMQSLFDDQKQILDAHTGILNDHTKRLSKIETEVSHIHRQVTDLKVDTPTLSEHKNLEKRVIRLEDHAFAS